MGGLFIDWKVITAALEPIGDRVLRLSPIPGMTTTMKLVGGYLMGRATSHGTIQPLQRTPSAILWVDHRWRLRPAYRPQGPSQWRSSNNKCRHGDPTGGYAR